MAAIGLCRCCLSRPPDKDLKSRLSMCGDTGIISDIFKECFEIHITMAKNDTYNGVCNICVERIKDAYDFKKQVVHCQKDFQILLNSKGDAVPIENETKVKAEVPDLDDDSDILLLDLKEEPVDIDHKQESDAAKLSQLLGIKTITKKKSARKKTDQKVKHSRRIILIEKPKSNRKTITLTTSRQITLRAVSQIKQPRKQITFTSTPGITENGQHKMNINHIFKYSNCTPFSNKTLNGYVCAFCKDSFQDPKDLRIHTRSEHENGVLHNHKRIDRNSLSVKIDIMDLRCKICDKQIDVISNLKKHLANEHHIIFYPNVMDYILEFKLTSTEMLNCALCNSSYETFKMLLQHMNGHYRNYICDICDLGFINKHKLINHKRTHEVGSFKCKFCDKIFSTSVRKACHEKYTHNTTARYTTNCPQCDMTFTSYYQRNRHMSMEHNTVAASYKCNICDKSFIMKSKLTSHVKKVHLMERNHICSECGQGFFIRQSLEEHMIKHNGERVHKCTICHKAYARKKTLREHMRIHNNDRRFKCDVCRMAFVQKCSLKSHMLSNHGIALGESRQGKSDLTE